MREVLAELKLSEDIYLWIVKKCPYCGEKHTHGGGAINNDPRKLLGHRVSHCKSSFDNEGYVLIEEQERDIA